MVIGRVARAVFLAAALASAPGAAHAVVILGSADVGYANVAAGSDHTSDFSGAGTVLFRGSHSGLEAQADFGYDHLSGSGGGAPPYGLTGGADLFLRTGTGTLGASYSHVLLGAYGGGGSQSLDAYGAFAEWYMNALVTLQVKGGGISVRGQSGAFGGGGAIIYPSPNLAINLNGAFMSEAYDHVSTFGAAAEYMPWDMPLSFSAGYEYTHQSGGYPGANNFLFTIKYRFGDPGAMTLQNFQRRGPIDWNGSFAPQALL